MNSNLLRKYIGAILESGQDRTRQSNKNPIQKNNLDTKGTMHDSNELGPDDLEGTKDPIEWIDSAKVSPRGFLDFWEADKNISDEVAPFAAMELAALRSGLTCIGNGSSRNVYELNDSSVIKLAINSAGIDQNAVESTASNDTEVGSIISKVYRHDPDFFWTICEKITPLASGDEKRFEQLSGIKNHAEFVNMLKSSMKGTAIQPIADADQGTAPLNKNAQLDRSGIPARKGSCLKGQVFIDSIVSFVGRYKDLLAGDITKIDSWGYTKYGCIVLFDYGISVKTFKSKYISGMFSPEKARHADKQKIAKRT